jgi:thiol-disulfide isomerase/thioredoxin
MKKIYFVISGLILVGFLTFISFFNTASTEKVDVYSTLSGIKGFSSNTVRDQYFILHFWAKWCEPCADEIPTLVEFSKKAQFSKPLQILAVSLDENLGEAKQILPNHGDALPANFILLLDPEHKVAEKMGSYQYPETYFIDPKGQILEKWIGPQKWQKPDVFEFFKNKIL